LGNNHDRPNGQALDLDPRWEEIYESGEQLNLYPQSSVVSFIFRYLPKEIPRNEIRVLEIGCGAGNNLWFTAREGLSVSGLDASKSAIEFARKRFADEQLEADFRIGDFTDLPFEDNIFHLAINRAAITQTGRSGALRAVNEVNRTLIPGGKFFNEIYSDCTTHHGTPGRDGVTVDIKGRLSGVGQICFYDRNQIDQLFESGWRILDLSHMEIGRQDQAIDDIAGEWSFVAEKV
jgi:SAM-dependent methyltransferase